jgi:serine/threonine-protein kinase RsbW
MGANTETRLHSVPVIERAHTNLKLTLPACPENVAVIRLVVGVFAAALRLPDDLVEDLRLAVTEACANVVLHAYQPDDPGLMEISIRPWDKIVSVVVSDRGRGIGTSSDAVGPSHGLPLIAAIADEVEFRPVTGGGSRVAMTFARQRPGDAV